ncbi:MAG: hypothetical protein DMG72_12970 [Acidobacteria bacterium]|nr:MAG: hypothetical protein DMG72_12970 [Acidobacteriota bacterium]
MKDRMLIAVVTILFSTPLFAQQSSTSAAQASTQDTAALEQRIKDLEERLIALEGQVRMLKSGQAQPAAAPQPQPAGAQPAETAAQAPPQIAAPAPTPAPAEAQAGIATTGGQLPIYGGASAASKALNPDISVIGDFVGAAGGNSAPSSATLQPFPSLQMHESEVGFQAIIDPYARGDFFISFGEEGVNLEEGYITFTALPAGVVAKVGKMRSVFGKVNLMHNHVLPWIDRPIVNTNLVGGEDGIDDAGVSIERILPAPKGIFLEATGQVFRGDSADVFKASQKSDVSTVAHLRGYKDITESTNLDIGLSYARGHNDAGTNSVTPLSSTDFLTQLYGVDATLRWKPLRRSIYHSFVGRSEFIWSQRQQPLREQRAFGFYTSADYQMKRRWFLGGRYDWSDRSRFANVTDKGGSVVLTYWPSEFSQIRGQYRFTNYAENIKANELLMQVIFSLGAHGAHPF